MASRKNDLKALRNLISEAHDLLRTINLPDARSERAEERPERGSRGEQRGRRGIGKQQCGFQAGLASEVEPELDER